MFDLSIFSDDDITPLFGTGDEYGVDVPDFSQDPAHPRPYLLEVLNWSATEVDFAAGASTIGGITVSVLDKRTDPSDQDTGILTTRLSEVVGRRALLRRLLDGEMVTAFNGVVQGYSMGGGPEGLVVVTLQLRDVREREREQPLFFSNFVLFGGVEGGEQGPGIDYGALPGGGYLIDAIEPFESISQGGIDHFLRGTTTAGVTFGYAATPFEMFVNLGDRGIPTQDIDGLYYFRDVWIRWREKGTADPWTVLRNMPAPSADPEATLPASPIYDLTSPSYVVTPKVYFGSFDAADIPETGQEIEFQILAVDITPDAPFFWDGGTFGDLLREIYDGDHSADPRPIAYSEEGMAAFAAATPSARFVLTEPVEDMREWVEQNIFQAVGYAPGFDDEQRIYPVSWALPENTADIPVIEVQSIVPIGDWGHSEDNVINTVEYTYLRESVADQETTQQKGGRKYLFFGPRASTDIVGTLSKWDRYFTTEVMRPSVNIGSIATFGTKKLAIKPATVRSIGDVDGRPIGGDVTDEAGAQLARRIGRGATLRFAHGAPVLEAEAFASDPVVAALKIGDWCSIRVTWFPDYATGRRGARRYMQVRSIGDENPIIRRLSLVDSGVPDPTATGDAACLSGGTNTVLPDGSSAMVWQVDGALVNACDHDVIVQVLAIAGGGGGGTGGATDTPGGGGAGGTLIVADVLIAAGATIPVTVGSGGAGGVSGEDTVLWAAPDGTPLVPGVDPPPVALRAIGGGRGGNAAGSGIVGGSGGGGGATLPIGGGSTSGGGPGTAGQGEAGGAGNSAGGIATCQQAAGGGGGSYGGVGTAGNVSGGGAVPGSGGPATDLTDWGVTAGAGGSGPAIMDPAGSGGACGPAINIPGVSGSGVGAGGGGGGFSGANGVLVIGFAGSAVATLAPPTVTSTDVETDGRVTVCVEEADWPPVALDGYRVRVDYAVGTLEPDAASGDWRLAGYLEAPGCVTTPPVPTGAKVWSRAIAEAPAFLPSEPNTPVDSDTPETPGLLAYALTIDELGVATVTWEPNAFAGSIKIRGLIHDDAASVDRPLAFVDDETAAAGTYALPGTVPQTESYTIDLEAWGSLGVDPGMVYRLSQEQPYGVDFPDTTGVPAGALLGWDGAFPEWVTTISYANLPTGSGTWAFGAANALTLEGQLVVAAGTTARAGLLLTVGVAPTGGGLVDGGIWVTTAGFFGRAAGATVALGVTLPLVATQGGTGLTAYTTGDMLYASATNVLSARAIGATGAFLRVTGGIPTWSTLTLPNTLLAGRVLITTAADTVGGLTPTSGRALVADGSTASFTTLPFAAMPAVAGTWDVGAGNTLMVTRTAIFQDVLSVTGLLRIAPRGTPASPVNGDIWIDSATPFELKYRANGVTYRVTAVTP